MSKALPATVGIALMIAGCAAHEDGLSRPTRDAIRAGANPEVTATSSDPSTSARGERGGVGWVRIDHYGGTARTQRGRYGYLESRGTRATVRPAPNGER